MVLSRAILGEEEAVAFAGLENVSAVGMSEGKVGWMVLAATSASGLLWELRSVAGFTWRGCGLMKWAPRLNLEGAKAVEMYGGYMMQNRRDADIILNILAMTQLFSSSVREQIRKRICGYILLFCSALLFVANTSTAATDLRRRGTVAQV